MLLSTSFIKDKVWENVKFFSVVHDF